MIHTQSSKIQHYLGLVDIYLQLGKPTYYEIETPIGDDYIPDAFTIVGDTPVLVELQRSLISNRKMQDKVDKFVKYYPTHGATHLWVFTEHTYHIDVPSGFTVLQKKMTPPNG